MWIYSTKIRLKNGKTIYARSYGKKPFRFWVNVNDKTQGDQSNGEK